MTEEQLSALLRLKRYEKPPEGYFDELLVELHRRQRAELLKRSLWQLAWDRAQTFFGEHSMGSLSYAGAMAGLMVFGVIVIGVFVPARLQIPADALASARVPQGPAPSKAAIATASRSGLFQLQPAGQGSGQFPGTEVVAFSQGHSVPHWAGYGVRYAPRHVLDARPASYEPSNDF